MSHLTWTIISARHHVRSQKQKYIKLSGIPQENYGWLKCMKCDIFPVRDGQTHHEVLPLITDVWASNAKEFLFMLTWLLPLNKCLAYLQTASVSQSLFCSSKKNFNGQKNTSSIKEDTVGPKGRHIDYLLMHIWHFLLCSLFKNAIHIPDVLMMFWYITLISTIHFQLLAIKLYLTFI